MQEDEEEQGEEVNENATDLSGYCAEINTKSSNINHDQFSVE